MKEFVLTLTQKNILASLRGETFNLEKLAHSVAGVRVVSGDPRISVRVEVEAESEQRLRSVINGLCTMVRPVVFEPFDQTG